MPVFINEVVVRGEIDPSLATSPAPVMSAADAAAAHAALVVAGTEAVMDRLERELDRLAER